VHLEQEAEEAAEYVPAPHSTQEVDWEVSADRDPAEHEVQTGDPVESEKVPEGQLEQLRGVRGVRVGGGEEAC